MSIWMDRSMGEKSKHKLMPIELDYYCALFGVDRADIADGWIEPQSGAVELVKVGFIDRITVNITTGGKP